MGLTALVRYEAARSALAECQRVDEVKDIRDKAEAMAAYARQAKDTELLQYASEIKVRSARRCGELLRTAAERGERAGNGDNRHSIKTSDDATSKPTLLDMGITRDESSRYQQLADMPEDHFETAIATAKDTKGEVTTAFMLRAAKTSKPSNTETVMEADDAAKPRNRSRADRIVEMSALVQSGHNVEQIADAQGITVPHVRQLLRDADINVPGQKRGRLLDPNKIVRESVAALSGIAQGLSLVRHLGIDAAEAEELLSELRSAMKALRALDVTLKEIVNGK